MHNARNLFNLHSSQLFMPPAECIPGIPPRLPEITSSVTDRQHISIVAGVLA